MADLTGIGTAIQGIEGLAQIGVGLIGGAKARREQKSLLAQRKAYQSPDEIQKILNLTLSQAGGDTIARNYQTNALDNAFSGYFGSAERLGANPNDLSAAFQQKMNGIFQIGEQFHQSNTEAFSKILGAYSTVAQGKDAEYVSEQDLLKDRLAATNAKLNNASGNLQSGLNTLNSGISSYATQQLYKNQLNGSGTSVAAPSLAIPNSFANNSQVPTSPYIN